MTSNDAGSLAWGEETRGLLGHRERRELRRLVLGDMARFAGSRLRTATGRGRRSAVASLEVIDVPDTKLALAIESVAAKHQSRAMFSHALRTVAFSHAVAALDGIEVDPELLWCACLMHDVAIESPKSGQCFAVRGGQLARDTALAAGATAETAYALGDAVSRHATPGLDPAAHPLPAMVMAGALVDVLGLRLDDMHPAFGQDLLTLHPREGFASALAGTWRAESRATPQGRAALVSRVALFPLAAQLAPLPK
jgi:hypothetical protein